MRSPVACEKGSTLHRDLVPIKRALLSVSDKHGLIELASALAKRGVVMLASGGTKAQIANAGLPVIEVADYTGQPEILGGRVKTLHPKLHAGILARDDFPEDSTAIAQIGAEPIDLVVVNLYPFEQTIAKPNVSFEDAVEQIDIGGPSLARAAAKNHARVAVLSDPSQYKAFIEKFGLHGGVSLAARRELAAHVFLLMSRYESAIARYFETAVLSGPNSEQSDGPFRPKLELSLDLKTVLRYGENPHQKAALYIDPSEDGEILATATMLHGKELSYNNLLDLDNALRLVRSFSEPAAAILKHNNPCGMGTAETLDEAFELAYEGDPVMRLWRNRRAEQTARRGDRRSALHSWPVHRGNHRSFVYARRLREADDHTHLEKKRAFARARRPDRSWFPKAQGLGSS